MMKVYHQRYHNMSLRVCVTTLNHLSLSLLKRTLAISLANRLHGHESGCVAQLASFSWCEHTQWSNQHQQSHASLPSYITARIPLSSRAYPIEGHIGRAAADQVFGVPQIYPHSPCELRPTGSMKGGESNLFISVCVFVCMPVEGWWVGVCPYIRKQLWYC